MLPETVNFLTLGNIGEDMQIYRRPEHPPLESLTCNFVGTSAAAHYLGRAPKTLHNWTSSGQSPIQAIRIKGRLAWSVADIRKVSVLRLTSAMEQAL